MISYIYFGLKLRRVFSINSLLLNRMLADIFHVQFKQENE